MNVRCTDPVPTNATGLCFKCGYYFLPGEETERCPCGTPRYEDYAVVWAREHPEEAAKANG